MAGNNIHIIKTDADGSFCTTDSQRHVDVVGPIRAAAEMNRADQRGDFVIPDAVVPGQNYGITATTPDDCGTDTGAQARHGC